MSRPELLERYRALPLPTTADEHWRFTDLKGFDPDAFQTRDRGSEPLTTTMLDLDVAAIATVSEGGIEIERAPEGVTFEPLDEGHPRLQELVGYDEKFAAHNAAMWKHGVLVVVQRGVVLEKPLYVRVANGVEQGSLFFRLLVVAEPESRFSLIEEYASAAPGLAAYTNAVAELFVEQGAKLEYAVEMNRLIQLQMEGSVG